MIDARAIIKELRSASSISNELRKAAHSVLRDGEKRAWWKVQLPPPELIELRKLLDEIKVAHSEVNYRTADEMSRNCCWLCTHYALVNTTPHCTRVVDPITGDGVCDHFKQYGDHQ